MTTFVHSDEEFARMYKFRTQENQLLLVRQFEDGIATIEPTGNYKSLEEFAEVISGCLDKNSNFKEELFKVYGYDGKFEFLGINFIIIGVEIFIPAKEISVDELVDRIKTKVFYWCGNLGKKLIDTDFKIRHESYIENILKNDEVDFYDMESEIKWGTLIDISEDDETYQRIINYAGSLAVYVQYLIKYRKKDFLSAMDMAIEDIDTLADARPDEKEEAIFLLTQYWKYQDELIMWIREIISFQLQNFLD